MVKRNPIKGPGKYEGELFLTKYASEAGFYDEELGDVEGFGWYGKIDNLEVKGKGPFYGIISENNQGFVSGVWYKTQEEMQEAWTGIEEAYEEFAGEEEEED